MAVGAVIAALSPASAPASDPVGGGAAGRAARAELRHREYHRDGPSPLTRAVDWVLRHVGRLLDGGSGSAALLLVFLILVAGVVLLAVRAGAPQRRVVQPGGVDDPLAPVTARDHRRIAAELTGQGRHAEALREWLRAAVQAIEERGVLPPRPGRTGAATAREAGPLLPRAAADLVAATAAFDEVWFGRRAATVEDVARARAAADAVASARVSSSAPVAHDGLAVPR